MAELLLLLLVCSQVGDTFIKVGDWVIETVPRNDPDNRAPNVERELAFRHHSYQGGIGQHDVPYVHISLDGNILTSSSKAPGWVTDIWRDHLTDKVGGVGVPVCQGVRVHVCISVILRMS